MSSFIPCESTADPEVQFLTSIYRQSLVPVGFSESGHGVTDIRVCDGAELCAVHCTIITVRLVHHRLNGIQHLRWYNHTNKSRHCTQNNRTEHLSYMDNLRLYFLSIDSDSPQNKCSLLLYHNPTTAQHSHKLLLQPVNKQQLCYLKIYGRVFKYVKI